MSLSRVLVGGAPRLLGGLVRRTVAWPTESQHVSRRNAMVAATAMARDRLHRLEVEEFLRDRHATSSPLPEPDEARDVI